MRAVPYFWTLLALLPQHFYSGPRLARDDTVESRACNLGEHQKKSFDPIPTMHKNMFDVAITQFCKFMSSGSDFLGSFDPPRAQTCLLPSACNPQLEKLHEKMLFISK